MTKILMIEKHIVTMPRIFNKKAWGEKRMVEMLFVMKNQSIYKRCLQENIDRTANVREQESKVSSNSDTELFHMQFVKCQNSREEETEGV